LFLDVRRHLLCNFQNLLMSTTRQVSSRIHILLGVTGSVAAIKVPELVIRLLEEFDAEIRIILSRGGANFWYLSHEYNRDAWNSLQAQLKTVHEPRSIDRVNSDKNLQEIHSKHDSHATPTLSTTTRPRVRVHGMCEVGMFVVSAGCVIAAHVLHILTR
jgi:hypothetical protein